MDPSSMMRFRNGKQRPEDQYVAPMKWSEGEHMLHEMERARVFHAVVREDTCPIEMTCSAVWPEQKKIVLGLDNGNAVVCERH